MSTWMVASVVLGASRNLTGIEQEPQSQDCPHLLEALGGENMSLGQGRRPTSQPMEDGLEVRSSDPESLDWIEMLGQQCHLHTAPPTGEACFPGDGIGCPGQGPAPSHTLFLTPRQSGQVGLVIISLQIGTLRVSRGICSEILSLIYLLYQSLCLIGKASSEPQFLHL